MRRTDSRRRLRRRPGPRRSGRRAGAQRLRRLVAARRLPAHRAAADLQLRRLEHPAAADRARRARPTSSRRRARPRRRRSSRRACCTRPVTFATNKLVLIVPNGNPGNIRSVYSLRSGGPAPVDRDRRRARSATTRASCCAACGLSSVLSSNTVSQETNVANVASKVALGSADAGFVYVTDGARRDEVARRSGCRSWAQPPVRYQICTVRRAGADTGGAASFIRRVHRPGRPRRVLKRLRVRPAAARVMRRARLRPLLLALCAAITLTFLALPIVALFTEVPLRDVPGLLSDAGRAGRAGGHAAHEPRSPTC